MAQDRRAQQVILVVVGLVGFGLAVVASPTFGDAARARDAGPLQLPGGILGGALVIGVATVASRFGTVVYRSRTKGSITLSLSIFAWVLLLPFVPPLGLVLGSVVGYAANQIATRQRVVVKAVFNIALGLSSSAVMVLVHQLVTGGEVVGRWAWLGAVAAIVVSSLFQVAALHVVMRLYDDEFDAQMMRFYAQTSTVLAGVLGTFAAVCIELIHADRAAIVLGIAIVATLAAGMNLLDHRGRLVGDLEDAVEELEHRERHDALTGLPNRRAFSERVDEAAAEGASTVLLFGLNQFRDVNETLGHASGDALLVETGRRLGAAVRHGDVVARYGADRFAVLLRDLGEHDDLGTRVDRLLAAIEKPHRQADIQVQTTAAVGVAYAGTHGRTGDLLLRRAEIAMFHAKDNGVRLAVFDPSGEADAPRRLQLATDLRRAIGERQLWVAYQPKMDLHTGEVVGVEALCRWQHPEHGAVSPEEFIAIAERTGLIRGLTKAVLATALADAQRWRAGGVDLTVAVNVSPSVLRDEGFASHLAEQVLRHGIEPGALTLEVTESVVLHDSDRIEQSLARVDELGIHLSIDDYGTGYSSLSYLRRLRVQEIKIDRSFVSDLVTNANDAVLVDSTIKLGQALGLKVVAEGVEDLETLQRLRILGCDVAQGWVIGKPMSADDLFEFARDHDPSRSFVAAEA